MLPLLPPKTFSKVPLRPRARQCIRSEARDGGGTGEAAGVKFRNNRSSPGIFRRRSIEAYRFVP